MLGIRPLIYLAIALAVLATYAATYSKGVSAGKAAEAREAHAREDKARAKAAEQEAALRKALQDRDAELARRAQEGVDAIEKVRTEFLPGKIQIRREVVEKPVYRECRIGGGVLLTLNAALRGHPTPGEALDLDPDGMSSGARPSP